MAIRAPTKCLLLTLCVCAITGELPIDLWEADSKFPIDEVSAEDSIHSKYHHVLQGDFWPSHGSVSLVFQLADVPDSTLEIGPNCTDILTGPMVNFLSEFIWLTPAPSNPSLDDLYTAFMAMSKRDDFNLTDVPEPGDTTPVGVLTEIDPEMLYEMSLMYDEVRAYMSKPPSYQISWGTITNGSRAVRLGGVYALSRAGNNAKAFTMVPPFYALINTYQSYCMYNIKHDMFDYSTVLRNLLDPSSLIPRNSTIRRRRSTCQHASVEAEDLVHAISVCSDRTRSSDLEYTTCMSLLLRDDFHLTAEHKEAAIALRELQNQLHSLIPPYTMRKTLTHKAPNRSTTWQKETRMGLLENPTGDFLVDCHLDPVKCVEHNDSEPAMPANTTASCLIVSEFQACCVHPYSLELLAIPDDEETRLACRYLESNAPQMGEKVHSLLRRRQSRCIREQEKLASDILAFLDSRNVTNAHAVVYYLMSDLRNSVETKIASSCAYESSIYHDFLQSFGEYACNKERCSYVKDFHMCPIDVLSMVEDALSRISDSDTSIAEYREKLGICWGGCKKNKANIKKLAAARKQNAANIDTLQARQKEAAIKQARINELQSKNIAITNRKVDMNTQATLENAEATAEVAGQLSVLTDTTIKKFKGVDKTFSLMGSALSVLDTSQKRNERNIGEGFRALGQDSSRTTKEIYLTSSTVGTILYFLSSMQAQFTSNLIRTLKAADFGTTMASLTAGNVPVTAITPQMLSDALTNPEILDKLTANNRKLILNEESISSIYSDISVVSELDEATGMVTLVLEIPYSNFNEPFDLYVVACFPYQHMSEGHNGLTMTETCYGSDQATAYVAISTDYGKRQYLDLSKPKENCVLRGTAYCPDPIVIQTLNNNPTTPYECHVHMIFADLGYNVVPEKCYSMAKGQAPRSKLFFTPDDNVLVSSVENDISIICPGVKPRTFDPRAFLEVRLSNRCFISAGEAILYGLDDTSQTILDIAQPPPLWPQIITALTQRAVSSGLDLTDSYAQTAMSNRQSDELYRKQLNEFAAESDDTQIQDLLGEIEVVRENSSVDYAALQVSARRLVNLTNANVEVRVEQVALGKNLTKEINNTAKEVLQLSKDNVREASIPLPSGDDVVLEEWVANSDGILGGIAGLTGIQGHLTTVGIVIAIAIALLAMFKEHLPCCKALNMATAVSSSMAKPRAPPPAQPYAQPEPGQGNDAYYDNGAYDGYSDTGM